MSEGPDHAPPALVADPDALGRVEREITVLLRRTLEEVWSGGYGDGAVNRFTYPVLALLDAHGPQGLTELTRRLGISKPTTSRHVARLACAHLVDSRPDRRDPRAVVVTLTQQGADQVATVRAARRARLAEVMTTWSAGDTGRLAELLNRLNTDLHSHP